MLPSNRLPLLGGILIAVTIILTLINFAVMIKEYQQLKLANVMLEEQTRKIQELQQELQICRSYSSDLENYTLQIYSDLLVEINRTKFLISETKLLTKYIGLMDSYHANSTPTFIRVAQEVSQSHIYNIETYNCNDFVNEYVCRMAKLGQPVQKAVVVMSCPSYYNSTQRLDYCFGDNYSLSRHAIAKIEVFVDATSGTYIDIQDYGMFGIWDLLDKHNNKSS